MAAHGTTVMRVCRAVVGVDDADDAWSETFLAALRAYPDLPAGTNMEAWLVTVAHRRSLDMVRARARRPVPTAQPPDAPADTDTATREVWALVARLPPAQRRAVAYHHLAGLSHAEVAGVVGCSTDAARRACADGMAALRAMLVPVNPTREDIR